LNSRLQLPECARSLVSGELLALFREAEGTPCPWGWPQQRRKTWKKELPIIRCSSFHHDRTVPSVCEAAVPDGWSLSALAVTHGETSVEIVDRMPIRADDTPPATRPLSFTTRVRFWELIDYARGFPPSHTFLREMSDRLWRARWTPWNREAAISVPPPFLEWPASLPVTEPQVCVAPPGAVWRTCQPAKGSTDWMLWQLDGVQQVGLLPPADSLCTAGRTKVVDESMSSLDMWSVEAEILTRVLCPGECLLVPAGWWFSSRALVPSLSVSSQLGAKTDVAKTVDAFSLDAASAMIRGLEEGRLVKRLLTKGCGPVPRFPRFNAICYVNSFRGDPLECTTFREDGTSVFFVGTDRSLGLLEDALRSMMVGERAVFAFTSQSSPVAFDMELLATRLPEKVEPRKAEYWEAWSSWFDDPCLWRPLPVDFPTNPGPMRQCARCSCSSASLRCARCAVVFYCGEHCQREHWLFHKSDCRTLCLDRERSHQES